MNKTKIISMHCKQAQISGHFDKVAFKQNNSKETTDTTRKTKNISIFHVFLVWMGTSIPRA